jgi:hypothetical protein
VVEMLELRMNRAHEHTKHCPGGESAMRVEQMRKLEK